MAALIAFLCGLAVAYGLCRPRRVATLDSDATLAYHRLQSGRARIALAMLMVAMVIFFAGILSMATDFNNDLFLIRNPCGDRPEHWCWSLNSQNQWVKEPT